MEVQNTAFILLQLINWLSYSLDWLTSGIMGDEESLPRGSQSLGVEASKTAFCYYKSMSVINISAGRTNLYDNNRYHIFRFTTATRGRRCGDSVRASICRSPNQSDRLPARYVSLDLTLTTYVCQTSGVDSLISLIRYWRATPVLLHGQSGLTWRIRW